MYSVNGERGFRRKMDNWESDLPVCKSWTFSVNGESGFQSFRRKMDIWRSDFSVHVSYRK